MAFTAPEDERVGGSAAAGFVGPSDEAINTLPSAEDQRQYVASLSASDAPLPTRDELLSKAPDYYNQSATGRDLRALGTALFSNEAKPDYLADEGPFARRIRGLPFLGPLLANAGHSIGELASSAKDTVDDAQLTGYQDRVKNGPLVATGHLIGSAALGIPGAAYNIVNPIANVIERGVKDVASDAIGGKSGAAFDAQRDLDRVAYERNYERPAREAILSASANPAITTSVENTLPLVVPLGAGIETGPLAARLSSRLGTGVRDAIASSGGELLTDVAGHAVASHLPIPGMRGIIRPLVRGAISGTQDAVGNAAGYVAKSVASPALSTVGPLATASIYGLGSSELGNEVEGVRGTLGIGALGLVPALARSGFLRKAAEDRPVNQAYYRDGLVEYGTHPELDATVPGGMQNLSLSEQTVVNQTRGVTRRFTNANNQQIQIYPQAPNVYADGAAAANGGQVSDAARSRGYYTQNGQIFLNTAEGNIQGRITEALRHELSHAALQDVLPQLNPRLASKLNAASGSSALDAQNQPTSEFKKFVDDYAQRPVDWAKLPDDGNGLTKRYFLNEWTAQHGAANTDFITNPARYSLPTEASDRIGGIFGGLAQRVGLGRPNVATVNPDTVNVAASPALLGETNQSFRALGRAAYAQRDVPVRPGSPVVQSADPANVGANTRRVQTPPQGSGETSPQAQVTPSFRDTQAYQDALAVATLSKKFAGFGISQADAQILLDRAAQDPTVPNTNTDYLAYITKARNPTIGPRPAGPSNQATQTVVEPLTETTVAEPESAPARGTAPAAESQAQAEVSQSADEAPAQGGVIERPTVQPVSKRFETAAEFQQAHGNAVDGSALPIDQLNQSVNSNLLKDGERKAVSSLYPTTQPAPAAIPFTADAVTQLLSDTARDFKPKPYKPRSGTPAEQAAKIADNLADQTSKAQRDAITPLLEQHRDALSEGDNRVRLQIDDETGQATVKGSRFVDGDPLHDALISHAGLTDEGRANLAAVQDAIATGRELNFDYLSADTAGTGVTGTGRKTAQVNSTASDRAAGEGAIQEADKSFVPLGFQANQNGSIQTFGFSPDKLIGNAVRGLKYLLDRGDRSLPFSDVNDPAFTAQFVKYARNHANGWKGDGSAALKSTDAISANVTPGYQGEAIPKAQADFFNLITQGNSESAKTTKGRYAQNGANIREFAKANGLELNAATNEVNALRGQINARGDFTAPDAEGGMLAGTKEILESPWENNRIDLIRNLRQAGGEAPATGEQGNLRAQAYRGARGDLLQGGLTNSKFSSAGFLPARSTSEVRPLSIDDLQVGPEYRGQQDIRIKPGVPVANSERGILQSLPSSSITQGRLQTIVDEVNRDRSTRFPVDQELLNTAGANSPYASSFTVNGQKYDWNVTTYDKGYEYNPNLPIDQIAKAFRSKTGKPLMRVEFGVANNADGSEALGRDRFGVTGRNLSGARQVMRVAENLTASLANSASEGGLVFTAKEPSRQSLYERIIKNSVNSADGWTALRSTNDTGTKTYFMVRDVDVGPVIKAAKDKVEIFGEQEESNTAQASPATQFLPAREAGATPEQTADATRQWQEKGTDSPYFQNWFTKSKVVDAKGNPLLVYHGTKNGGFDEFESPPDKDIDYNIDGSIYFTSDKNGAEDFARSGSIRANNGAEDYIVGDKPQVYGTYLNIRKPLEFDQPVTRYDKDQMEALAAVQGYSMRNGAAERQVQEWLDDPSDAPTVGEWLNADSGTLHELPMNDLVGWFDGIIDKDRDVYAVFNPHQIRIVERSKVSTER